MQNAQPKKSPRRKRDKIWPPRYPTYNYLMPVDGDNVKMAKTRGAQETPTVRSKLIYYTLVFLKVALWIIFAWILSHLHLGAPCFFLALTLWVYSNPMHKALKWARRRLRCPAA